MASEPYQQILLMVRGDLREVGGDLQRGASGVEIERLQERTRRELGSSLPFPYQEFLRITDGLSWGGVAIFGTSASPIVGFSHRSISGFVESNIGFRNSSPFFGDHLVFGSDGDSLFSYCIVNNRYEVFTVFMTPLSKFDSFEEMICCILKKQM